MHTLRAAFLAALIATVSAEMAAAATRLTEKCVEAANAAGVESASKVEPNPPPDPKSSPSNSNTQQAPPEPVVTLGDMIAVRISKLADVKKECGSAAIYLYLNGYPIKTVRPYPPSPPAAADASTGELRFVLRVTDGTKATDGSALSPAAKTSEVWRPILGRPPWPWENYRDIEVSVGIEDQFPLKAAAGKQLPVLKLNVLWNKEFLYWGIVFVLMVGGFFLLVRRSNIIRNGNPTVLTTEPWAQPSTGQSSGKARARRLCGAYSLSKFQGAMWFFVIVAAYLLIGLVTGDYLDSINSTALILLGIGAGTVVGSAVIDRSKEDPAKRATEISDTEKKLRQIDDDIATIDARLGASPAQSKLDAANNAAEIAAAEGGRKQLNADFATITSQLATTPPPTNAEQLKLQAEEKKAAIAAADAKLDRLRGELAMITASAGQLQQKRLAKEDEKKIVLSNYYKLIGRSEGFIRDILSDANGVSFHRFQMAVFTVVLGIVFIKGVFDDLAMPEFNQTLMGLLGLSAGTYLGLKIPEATTPTKTETQTTPGK